MKYHQYILYVFGLILLALGCQEDSLDPVYFDELDLYISGEDGYDTYRIPSIIETQQGSLLAFCEGRKNGVSDTGDIDIVLKRSQDYGNTWSAMEVIIDNGDDTAGNPCPVVDRDTGRVWLPYITNYGEDTQFEILNRSGIGSRDVWITYSDDDGLTWAPPININDSVKLSDWTWYATGPGRSIQLQNGRLLVPCNHDVYQYGSYSHVIYSDDHGESWQLGGSLIKGTDESQVAQLSDGSVMINMRNTLAGLKRAVAISTNGGETWSETYFDQTLTEPVCQGSLLQTPYGLMFSNPDSILVRENLTIRLSYDDGQTWALSKTLYEGPSAYSALSILPNGGLACLYEKGENNLYETISFARFSKKWLKD
jgi:sialidase-1